MHDKPGVKRLNVAAADFETQAELLLDQGYELYAVVGMYMVFKKGYDSAYAART